jgi:hypothetical protein
VPVAPECNTISWEVSILPDATPNVTDRRERGKETLRIHNTKKHAGGNSQNFRRK